MSFDGEIKKIEAEVIGKIETKVKAASTVSTITALIVTLIGGLTVWHGAAVPAIVTSLVSAVVTGGLTFAGGWLARHTPRPSDNPPAPPAS